MWTEPDDSIPTRQTLLARLQGGQDQQSWQEFFDTYWRLIYGVALRAGLSDAEAQDVVQETVLAVTKGLKDFQIGAQHGSFKAWLLQITRRRIADQYRKRDPRVRSLAPRSEEATTPAIERIADPASLALDALWDEQWQRNLLDLATEKVKQNVSPKQWLMFQQFVLKGLPARRVATRCGVSLAQVYMAKYRIASRIRKEAKRLARTLG